MRTNTRNPDWRTPNLKKRRRDLQDPGSITKGLRQQLLFPSPSRYHFPFPPSSPCPSSSCPSSYPDPLLFPCPSRSSLPSPLPFPAPSPSPPPSRGCSEPQRLGATVDDIIRAPVLMCAVDAHDKIRASAAAWEGTGREEAARTSARRGDPTGGAGGGGGHTAAVPSR